uniref:eCIS core domain-containing protein n=1 Tax=Streptomyces polyasparticus TaxID=2767826 RepID=UPI001F383026|nr:DUF4157 domain-containing protein [Streptomyces polyasparticus]
MKSRVHRASETRRYEPVIPSGGTPVDTGVRRVMEGRLQYDFSAVRVHTDSAAHESAAAAGARAFTSGRDIVFGAGHYAPQSAAGRRLLAHELAHVVQQSGRPGTRQGRAGAETEAHEAAAGRAGPVTGRVESGPMQADDDPVELRRQLHALERQAAAPVHLSPDELATLAARRSELQARLAAAVRAAAHLGRTAPSVSRPTGEQSPGQQSVGEPSAGQQSVGESPTPESMVRLVVDQRHFGVARRTPEGEAQPIPDSALVKGVRGKAAGPGYQTNAAVQLIDAQGRQVAFVLAQYACSSQPHAEAQAVAGLRLRLAGRNFTGGKLIVAVDQLACEGCQARLRYLATDLRLSSYEVWAPTAQEGRTAGPKWTARTAATLSARPAPDPVSETPGGAAYRYEPRMIQGEMLAPGPSGPPTSPAPTTTPATPPASAASATSATSTTPATRAAPAEKTLAPATKPLTSAVKPPAAPEPASAKRPGATPPESAGIPRGSPGSVELIGQAHAGATGALMSQATTRLNELAREHPDDKDLARTVDAVNAVLDAESFIKDPKSFVAGEIKAGILNAVFSHFSEKLATNRQSFDDRFPALAQIQKDPIGTGLSLESYRKDYEASRARLRAPDAGRALLYAWVALSAGKDDPPEVIRQRLHEVDEAVAKAYDTQDFFAHYKWQHSRYQLALFLLTGRLEQLSVEYADLPSGMAEDLRTRGRTVHRAADVFRDTRDSLWNSRLVVFAPVLGFAQDMETVADGLDAIARQLESFAAAVGSRSADYDREVRRLRAETARASERPLFGR